MVALNLECATEPVSCPAESGGLAWGTKLAGLAKRVLAFAGVTSRGNMEEQPDPKVSPKAGGSEDVAASKLECAVELASCPAELGGPAGIGGAERAERAKWVPGSVGVTKLRQTLGQRLGEQMRLVPEESLDLEALLDHDRPLDGEELLDYDESLDSEEPLDYEGESEDLQAWVARLAEAFAGQRIGNLPYRISGGGGPEAKTVP